jgi:Fe-S-cluster containining protein
VKPAEELCRACGLCCDGTLFAHVRLGAGRDAAAWRTRGLQVLLTRTRPALARSPQPCAALCADRTCRIYAERPAQCRAFECQMFKDLAARRIESAAALRLVRRARRLADRARGLLRRLGCEDEHRPLEQRFLRVRRRAESGEFDASAHDLCAELSLVMHRLHVLAHERFHTRAQGSES